MKHLLWSILVSFALISCSKSPSSKLEGQAKDSFKTSLSELTENNKDTKIESINTVFSNDSLCILHIDVKEKNGIGVDVTTKVEYLFLSQGGKYYEAFQLLNEDSVYVSEPTLKKISKGTIYENLDYANAILYRTAMYMNTSGREVGNHDAEVKIPIPNGTGLWELDSFNDEFGNKTDDKYLRLIGKGQFSNSAATNADLTVLLFVDAERISLRFVEYNTHVVKEDMEICDIKIKDCQGVVHELNMWAESDGYIVPFNTQKEDFRKIIEKEGEISVIAEIGEYSISKYQFKLNLDGLKKAMTFL